MNDEYSRRLNNQLHLHVERITQYLKMEDCILWPHNTHEPEDADQPNQENQRALVD